MYELVLLALRRVKRQKQPKHPNLSGNESKECLCVHIKNANVITYPDKRYKRGRAKTRCYAGFKKTCNIQCTRSASFGTPYDTMYLVGSFRQRLFCFSFSLHEESGRTPGVMVPLGRKEENVKTTRTSSMKT